ncbi:ABC transporter permease [Fibrella forsythiae]|uniref:ABC transporter permease n=1 Tax=Fibrella forsythiae TaxID=2817061 RepID=A0ABS3JE20_9BACT|nr:ABC transporter permease [Fibrella forsythiae]MBO0948250.1 ABC transporter permease [Fibrella forsythiae]
MFRHYFIISFRSLRKNQVFTLINIVGLGLGIAAFGLIWEYIAFERSVNQFHQKLPNLYRVLLEDKSGETGEFGPSALAPEAQAAFPEIDAFCRLVTGAAQAIVSVPQANGGAKTFRETNAALADGSFFSMFTFPLVSGNPASLKQPNTVFLSASTARRYFDDQAAVGKPITVNGQFGQQLYTVGGVYADMPENSDVRFDLLYSLETLANPANLNGNGWASLASYNSNFLQASLLLRPGTDADALARKLTTFYRAKKPDETNTTVRLQAAKYSHLGQSLDDPFITVGSLAFVYLLSALALLIVLIAWLNYVNLSTATALTRAKELGVRKVVGATQSQLVGQLLGESVLINALGFMLGLLLISLIQPVFNQFVGKQLSIGTLLVGRPGELGLWFWGLLTLLVGSLVSGCYVAYALTRVRSVDMMRGGVGSHGRATWLRQSLVVVQFGIALVLIVATVVMFQQVQFLRNRPLGLTMDRLLAIKSPEVGKQQTDFASRRAAFVQQVAQRSYVQEKCYTGSVPGNFYNFSSTGITRQNPTPEEQKRTYNMIFADDEFIPTFGIRLLAGQNFTQAQTEVAYEKGGALILNERAALDMGFSSAKEAIGKVVLWGSTFNVVGVVSNYRHQSPKQSVEPVIIIPRAYNGYLTIRLAPGNVSEQLADLSHLYKASYPGNPFDYFFVEQKYNEQYQTEQRYGQLFSAASALAIFIACLGLFGLAAFTAQRRTKEIGVRKVLGASVVSIVALLSGDFLKLVGAAFVLAVPLAWWAMDYWLRDFAEKTPLHWWLFAGAGTFVSLIALLTVSFQSVRAALADPVTSLRSE